MKIIKNLVPKEKYDIKCPFEMKPTRIVVHNTANSASAKNEVAYMISNNNETSFHYAVDDVEVVQGIEENRNAWHAGDGNGIGNRQGIAIEICYSKNDSDVEKFVKAEKNAVELIVDILIRYNWGIDKVTKHQDYSGKFCPHRTLEYGWDRFIKMVEDKLNEKTKHNNTYATNSKVNVFYRVKTEKHSWLPEVKNLEDYAGYENSPIIGLALKVDKGSVKYRVHVKGGGWLGWMKDYNINDYYNGYAGNNKPIDAIQVYYYTPNYIRPYKKAIYKVNNYGWQHDTETKNGQDGYAGIFGKTITKIQIKID